ncbi:MAG: N-acetylmuramoyl-L-alanine amidase [Frankiaceae bacterium]|nr:N-acetylmuramoyl-L-alanine amidase [Frankiaceae bacterium]
MRRTLCVAVTMLASLAGVLVPAAPAQASGILAGKIVGIDPGHNGRNYTSPSFMSKQVWNGRAWEDCDTTGTETRGGYAEHAFNWAVANYLAQKLRAAGAKVVWTRSSDTGLGPCVDQRARLLNRGHANISIDIHADGGPTTGRGFAILLPVADGPNNKVIKSSVRFGGYLRSRMISMARMPVSTYDGSNGFAYRRDLAGLNLTTEPKVLIECGNMRNSTDAKLLGSKAWQLKVADAMASAIVKMLVG